jgi:hypothetical protein
MEAKAIQTTPNYERQMTKNDLHKRLDTLGEKIVMTLEKLHDQMA